MFRKRKGLIVLYHSHNVDYFRSLTSETENYAEMFDQIIDEIVAEFGKEFVITNVIKL